MIRILIKKAFFNTWDNLFRVVFLNIGFLIPTSLFIYAPNLSSSAVTLYLLRLFAIAIFIIYTGAASSVCYAITNYKTPGFAMFYSAIRISYRSSLLFIVVNVIWFQVLSVAFQVYGNLSHEMIKIVAQVVLVWITISWLVAVQLFFPVQSSLDHTVIKIFKKMILLFFDNAGVMFLISVGSLITMSLSVVFGTILPGLGAVLIWQNAALRLLLYKYDYLEKNPKAIGGKIPWDEILIEEKERIGNRTLRGMIFPWKE